MLNEAGFIWDVQLYLWKERFTLLKEVYLPEYNSPDEIPKPGRPSTNWTEEEKDRNIMVGWIKVRSFGGECL